MKHKRLSTLLLPILVLFLFGGCEEVMEFDIEEGERHVVVNALPCTDSVLFVNVTYSRFFLDNQSFLPVTGATVTVDVNGVSIASTTQEGANWMFGYTATAGDLLTVHVSVAGREEVSGTTVVPSLPDMTVPVAEIDTLQPISAGEITFSLSDPVEVSNYYYIYVLEHDSGSRWNRWEEKWDTIDTVVYAYFNCLDVQLTDPSVNRTEGLFGYFDRLLLSDSLINGETHEVLISLPMFKDTAENPIRREYTLVVESLSEEAFHYVYAVTKAQSMTQMFAEPERIYTNLTGGLGIFAGIAKRVYRLEFVYKEQEDPPRLPRRR